MPRPLRTVCGISIHALREEGDELRIIGDGAGHLFLSTPSARRATYKVDEKAMFYKHFYPRPPRGGRRARR